MTYSFNNAAGSPARLNSIQSSDGRKVTFSYDSRGHIAKVNDGDETWKYTYDYSVPAKGRLTTVRLPDDSSWSINFAAFGATRINYQRNDPGTPWRDCENPGDVANEIAYTGVITHPSGAVGEFSVYPTRFGRTNVPKICGGYREPPYTNPGVEYSYYPVVWDAFAISKKRITGPGLPAAEWQYQFLSGGSFNDYVICNQANGCTPACVSDTCAGTTVAEVAGPDQQYTRYTFGNSFRYNEGKLLKVESGSIPGPLENIYGLRTILKSETKTYELAQSGQAYPTPIGRSPQQKGDGFSAEYLNPLASTTIVQDGAIFQSAVANCGSVRCYDVFGRATRVVNSSSLGYAKTVGTEYEDALAAWVIGQIKRTTINDVETERTVYDTASRLPLENYSFGKRQGMRSYNADGTVATIRDGNGNVTTLSNWKRGLPQLVRHPATPEAPAGATESAVVNDDGTLDSVTDETGSKTCYSYDAMGRIESVTYPSETRLGTCNTSKWALTKQSFAQIDAAEYGIPASHWRQDVATGNARKVTYFDAFWRPVLTWEHDASNIAGTQRFTRHAYNAAGQESFVSYPGTTDALITGVRTTYDPLGRVIQIDQDNELSAQPLTTRTEYLSGFYRRTTNPRGNATLEQFEAYDTPTYEAPTVIDAPQGVRTLIQRNAFGNPTSITRSGPDG